MSKENVPQLISTGVGDEQLSSGRAEELTVYSTSRPSLDKEAGLAACRVCQCAESDKRGDAALEFLGITPVLNSQKRKEDLKLDCKDVLKDAESDTCAKDGKKDSGFVEFVSPDGEVFICNTDIEKGFDYNRDVLIELGCACKNDLALVHYACALKWFVNHGSTVCEICGRVSKNINVTDLKKVVASLKEYETLRERTANGIPYPENVQTSSCVDPDALAAIRRQRLSEISLWFGPHNNNYSTTVSQGSEQVSNAVAEEVTPAENSATKWAVEGTGILLATGLLTLTLAWLIAPRVGKKTAKSGLHILLGGICALTVVVFFRFFVLTRIKYGPARYWAILFIFWFLVFGIWASRTHATHST
ncbi:hypothetical protein DCAR_0310856 [Daucus carota subsp. sativus]|uniref:RING-CH-type domain-containing protein n=1 Tax=Daucus carota subsp. sativus TaxID=79200 RepID=A0AAF1ASR7_DAUCS|nr:PREDICTED: uncharacterized protein LOC108215067 isoform X2 [Daucus carota subsp. sativus]WOG91607.1 hypothetical protein DCAR_0310856 [Daucus carota subsp. sativus]